MALDVTSYLPLDEFKKNTGDLLRQLRNSSKTDGKDRIYTAGEKEYWLEQEIRVKGIPLVPDLKNELKALQSALQLESNLLPF